MKIYLNYKPPPDPPEHLWLTIDYNKINFNDMIHIKIIYTYIPETYNTLNMMYKIHKCLPVAKRIQHLLLHKDAMKK